MVIPKHRPFMSKEKKTQATKKRTIANQKTYKKDQRQLKMNDQSLFSITTTHIPSCGKMLGRVKSP